jgi:H+/gluconate symporter-like permease
MVILIADAGDVFGKVLVDTGIGAVVSDMLRTTGLPVVKRGHSHCVGTSTVSAISRSPAYRIDMSRTWEKSITRICSS